MFLRKWMFPFILIALAIAIAACSDKGKKEETNDGGVNQEAIDEMNKKLAKQEVDDDLLVAIVNDEQLFGERYNIILQSVQMQFQQMGQDPTSDEMLEHVKSITLDELVQQTLLLQEAKSGNIDVSDEEIEVEYNKMVEQFGDEKTLLAALEAENIELAIFKGQIADSIYYSKYQDEIIPTVEVTDEEIEKYYNELANDAEGEEEFPPLEDLSEMIRSFIIQEEEQKFLMTHVEELKEQATIELKI